MSNLEAWRIQLGRDMSAQAIRLKARSSTAKKLAAERDFVESVSMGYPVSPSVRLRVGQR